MGREDELILRPTPRTAFRVLGANRRVVDDWNNLLHTRLEVAIRCWDHIAATPTVPIGGRYAPMKGDQAWCLFRGRRLRQWQWEIDRRARVRVAIGDDFVVILGASAGHPRENE